MSRWTMPGQCASATPRASGSISPAARGAGQGVPSSRRSRLPPGTYSSSKYGRPSASPMWWICTMLGCWRSGDGLRLGQEAKGGLDAGMGAAQDHLQDAGAIQEDLSGAVDDAHAAAAQLAQDLIAGDGGDGADGHLQGRADIAGGVGVGHHADRRVGPLGGIDGRLGPGPSRPISAGPVRVTMPWLAGPTIG